MNTRYKQLRAQVTLKRMLQLFFQGLIVLAPIAITLWVVVGLFQWVDGFLPNLINTLFPNALDKNLDGSLRKIPGLGFVVVVVLVLFVGWLSSLFVVEKLVSVFDTVLEKTPGIKFIYSSVKDFLEAFAGNKKKFDKPVLVNVDASGVWRIGFITQPTTSDFGLPDHVTVYVPHSYAISGITYIVPKTNIKILDNVSAVDAMKYTVSGGVTDVHDDNQDDNIITDINKNETA
jgi:uncharacterized membrane protein